MGLKSFLKKFGLFKDVTPVEEKKSVEVIPNDIKTGELASKVIEDRLAEVAKERKEEAKVVVKKEEAKVVVKKEEVKAVKEVKTEEPKVTAKEIKAKLKKSQPVVEVKPPAKKVVKPKDVKVAKPADKVVKPAIKKK